MSRRYPDTVGMVDFALDLGKKLSHVLADGVPEDARQHLLNAQRELITALVLMYEHQAGARRADLGERRAAAAAVRRRRPAAARRPAPGKIEIE